MEIIPRALTLDAAIQLAMTNNPEIQIALQEVRRNKAIVVETRAPALPQVSFSSVFSKVDPRLLGLDNSTVTTGDATLLPITESYVVTGSVRQVLYSASIAPRVRAAKLEIDNAFYQLRETVNRVENQVRREFYQALASDRLVEVQTDAVSLLESQSSTQMKRFEAGEITRFGVLQAQVARANQTPALVTARTGARLARVRLAQAIGIFHGPRDERLHPLKPVGDLDARPQKISEARAMAYAEANRPLLKIRQTSIKAEGERVKAARAGYLPTISANANYQLHNTTRSLDDTVNGYFAGVSLDWNIFDGAATKARVDQARIILNEANLRLLGSSNAVEAEVADASARLEEARRLIDSQRENIGQSQEAFDLARAQLQAGQGTQLDALTAQIALTQSRVTELQALASYHIAAADLDQAIGSSKVYRAYFDDPLLHVQKAPVVQGKRDK